MAFEKENYVSENPISDRSDSYGHYMKVDKVLFEGNSKYQKMLVINNGKFGNVLILDGFFQVSELDEHLYHEPLVQPAMFSHPNPKNVLIIGGGDGGALEEALKHKTVEKATMVELDGDVVRISRKYLKSVCKDAFSDKRTKLIIDDGRKFVENTKERFDVVVIDLTDPVGPSRMLYTKEFYALVSKILTENGVVALHTESPLMIPKIFGTIIRTLRSVFKHVNIHVGFVNTYAMVWSFANASNSIDIKNADGAELSKREKERGVKDLRYHAPKAYPNMFELPIYAKNMIEAGSEISIDKKPLDIKVNPARMIPKQKYAEAVA